MKSKFPQTYSIFFITFFDQVAITIAFPVLTFLCFDPSSHLLPSTATYASRSHWFGILNALPHFVAIFAAPFLGFFSDYIGRKKLLLIGALGAVVFSLFSTLSILFSMLFFILIGYIIQGACVRTEPIALAAIADCCDAKQKLKNMGYLQFWISVGACLGPILGGYFAKRFFFPQLNFSLPYIIGIFFGILTFLGTLFLFRETLKPHQRSSHRLNFQLLSLLNKKTALLVVLLVLTQLSWRMYYVFIPAVLKLGFHYSPVLIGNFLALAALWLAFASSIGIRILTHYCSEKSIFIGSIFSILTGLILTCIILLLPQTKVSGLMIWLCAIPIAAGDVVIYSIISTLFSNAVSQDKQGTIMGLNFIAVSLVWSFVGLIGGLINAINFKLPILLAPLSLVLLLIFLRKYLLCFYNDKATA